MGKLKGELGGPFRYGRQPGMTSGDTRGGYTNHLEESGPNLSLGAALAAATAKAGRPLVAEDPGRSLRDLGGEPYRVNGGVGFRMAQGEQAVRIVISDKALEDIDRPADHSIARFKAYRAKYAEIASAKHEGLLQEPDGSVFVRSDDLP